VKEKKTPLVKFMTKDDISSWFHLISSNTSRCLTSSSTIIL